MIMHIRSWMHIWMDFFYQCTDRFICSPHKNRSKIGMAINCLNGGDPIWYISSFGDARNDMDCILYRIEHAESLLTQSNKIRQKRPKACDWSSFWSTSKLSDMSSQCVKRYNDTSHFVIWKLIVLTIWRHRVNEIIGLGHLTHLTDYIYILP